MNLFENISLAVAGLISNKMRALLTMLGIIIGIGSVIAITSVGDAMTGVVSSSMESMGVNNVAIQVTPRDYTSSYTYTEDDLITDEMIEQYQNKYRNEIVGIGLMESAGSGVITKFHEDNKVSLEGVNEGFATGATGTQVDMLRGRFINESDTQRGKYVAVIAKSLADTLFPGNQEILGQEIKILMDSGGRQTFTIVGVYEDQANSFLMGSAGMSSTIYIPISTAYRVLDYTPDGYYYFYIAVQPGLDYQAFAEESAGFFNDRFYVKNETMHCEAQSLESMVKQVNDMLGTISTAIAVIAGISLLVGGIGVMNIMLVSVTERTREIGIRKALGAPDSAIRTQFIVESMIICVIGGALGILLGALLGYAGGVLLGMPAVPSIVSIVIAVGFSMLIGVFFGYYPANKAAKLDPIDALRYE